MKKIILAALSLSFTLTSCIKDADVTASLTQDKMDEIAESDPDKVFEPKLVGMYTDMQQYNPEGDHSYFGQKGFDYLTSLMGNDMIMTGRYAFSIFHHILDYRQQNYAPTRTRWTEYYKVITNANSILRSTDPESEDAKVKKYRALALGFRGYAYSQLTYLYQLSYYVGVEGTAWGVGEHYDYSESPCVPLILEDTEEDQPRSSLKVISDQIIADLTEAYNLFEEVGMIKTSDPTDIDGCVVATYLARVHMVRHNWDEAIKYADVVMSNFGTLTTEDEITQGFNSVNLTDVVFGQVITSDNSTIYASFFSQMDAYSQGYAAIGVSRAGYKPFVDRIADTDVRLKWFCTDRSTGVDGVDSKGNPIRVTMLRDTEKPADVEYQSVKFIGAGRPAIQASVAAGQAYGAGWEVGHYIYLRSEEAYFMKMESLAHQDKTADATAALNDFMVTRQPDYNYTFTNKAELIEEINFQKSVEFWGEGMEYLDNRRLNIPVDRTAKENNNHLAAAQIYADQEDVTFLYQIPLSEIENSKALSSNDQNP